MCLVQWGPGRGNQVMVTRSEPWVNWVRDFTRHQAALGRTPHQAPQNTEPTKVIRGSRQQEFQRGLLKGSRPLHLLCLPGFPMALGTPALPNPHPTLRADEGQRSHHQDEGAASSFPQNFPWHPDKAQIATALDNYPQTVYLDLRHTEGVTLQP